MCSSATEKRCRYRPGASVNESSIDQFSSQNGAKKTHFSEQQLCVDERSEDNAQTGWSWQKHYSNSDNHSLLCDQKSSSKWTPPSALRWMFYNSRGRVRFLSWRLRRVTRGCSDTDSPTQDRRSQKMESTVWMHGATWCGRAGHWQHECAADKLVEIVWCSHRAQSQGLEELRLCREQRDQVFHFSIFLMKFTKHVILFNIQNRMWFNNMRLCFSYKQAGVLIFTRNWMLKHCVEMNLAQVCVFFYVTDGLKLWLQASMTVETRSVQTGVCP